MGNNTSSIKKAEYPEQGFFESYIFLKKIKDHTYGKATLLQDKTTRELVALKEIFLKSPNEFYREIETFKQRCKVSHPNVVQLHSYYSKIEDNLCASFYRILLVIDYFDQDFEKEITAKKVNSEYFKEEHLWYLLKSILSALEFLQKNGIAHGDLKPSNILISRLGSYKIAEQSLFGNAFSSYMQQLSGSDDVRAYLSPSLIESLFNQELHPHHDAYKSDIFSLGLSVLHAATLTDCDEFFNWSNCRLEVDALQKRVNSLKEHYSAQFQDFIESMLTLDEGKRPSAAYLLGRLTGLQQQQMTTQIESKTSTSTGKSQPEPTQKHDVGSSNQKSQRSTKKPRIPQYISTSNAELAVFDAEPVTNKLNVRLRGNAVSGKVDLEASMLCPPEDPDNSHLYYTGHESVVLWSGGKSLATQQVSANKKEPDNISNFQISQPVTQPPQQDFQMQLPAVQISNSKFATSKLMNVSYNPPEEVSRILDEYRVKDVLHGAKNDDKSLLKTEFSQNPGMFQLHGGVSSNPILLMDNNSQSISEITLNNSVNLLATDRPLQLFDLQQQHKSSPDFSSQLPTYKSSPEVERILQEVRNRSNKTTNTNNSNAFLIQNKATSSFVQSAAGNYNKLDSLQYSLSYQQQGSGVRPNDSSKIIEQSIRNLQKDFKEIVITHPNEVSTTSKTDMLESYYEKISQASKFDLVTQSMKSLGGGNNMKTGYSIGNYSTTENAEKVMNHQSCLKNDKENYSERVENLPYSLAFKSKSEKQDGLMLQDLENSKKYSTKYHTNTLYNPLQPLSLNHSGHRRQISTSRTRKYFLFVLVITLYYCIN